MLKPVSVQLYSIREAAAKDFPAALKRIADIGFYGVEFAGLNGQSPKDLAKVLKDLGLKATSSFEAVPTRENVSQIVDQASVLGYDVIEAGFGPDDMKTLDEVKVCAEKLAAGVELLKPHGLTLTMHNHWWEFTQIFDGKYAWEIIMESAPGLMGELDIYWVTRGHADGVKVLGQWGKRVPMIHVKDGDLNEQGDNFLPLSEGKVPLKKIIESADEKTVRYLVIEIDQCEIEMFEALKRSFDWLVKNGLGYGKKK
jgi:sugar phosphate isomerase/epimerase